ncbi:WD40-repeat-containing domain protein [Hygrophoropsis aurantiaca]|uniref:WD40-repeat-containing domain protein n=1 Tax=Hygrophoropsis aurantiaca TaxID=72124 RepID=A0ACB8AKC1_9AGAM|nr:WD40-repeat-containing domain protein [Hygrophoropsis aurantiaca]
MAENSIPWFRDQALVDPFSPAADLHGIGTCHSLALFPWIPDSLRDLWAGDLNNDDLRDNWKAMIDQWSGTIAVGGSGKVRVFSANLSRTELSVKIPPRPNPRGVLEPVNVHAVAWALCQEIPLEPLLVLSGGSILHIVNVKKREFIGYLRGHGGDITSIAVHPIFVHLVCTTSRDFSTRIYDLTQSPCQQPNNLHWPLSKTPSLGGAPHGLQASEPEGTGIGRCVAVLVGGPSGGHNAPVLGATFHPEYPLIATCGLDRAVKIWRLPDLSGERLVREDKPLFSSSRIHKARIISVSWLSTDVLVTHCSQALMRHNDQAHEVYCIDGTIAVWQWLGFDRFFPPNQPVPARIMRGCASDYQESSSFKLLSVIPIPQSTRHMHVSHTHTGDYIVLLTLPDTLRLFNVASIPTRHAPRFPIELDSIADLAQKLHLDDDDDDESPKMAPEPRKWEVKIAEDAQNTFKLSILGHGGTLLIAGASDGKVHLWTAGGQEKRETSMVIH